MGQALDVGERFPDDIELPDDDGNDVRFSELVGKKPLVVYFYPRDETPGCTREACSFRDQYEDFTDAGAEVIGISDDTPERHKQFRENHGLPFVLLSDRGGRIRKRLGVKTRFGILPGRVTFVVGADGVVRHMFDSQIQASRHVKEALDALRQDA